MKINSDTQEQTQRKISNMASDMILAFKDMEDTVKMMFRKAVREGWTYEETIKKIEDMI